MRFVASFLFCFAINCILCDHFPRTCWKMAKVFLLEEQHRSMLQESLKFGVLKLSGMPEKKSAGTGKVNAGFRWKLETQRG